MFAHFRPIWAGASQLDFPGGREQAIALPANPFHHFFCQFALQHFDYRANRTRAIGANRTPPLRGGCGNTDVHLVNLRTADQSLNSALGDGQIDDRTIPDIGAPTRQAIGKIGIAIEVVAPRLAPKTCRNAPTLDDNGRNRLPCFQQLPDQFCRIGTPLCDRDVRLVTPIAHTGSIIALERSSRTRSSSSRFRSSVRLISPPPPRNCMAICCFASIISSIRSSMVPRQTNL